MNWGRVGMSMGLVLLTNAIVLAGVAYNRSGETHAVMTLTERELPLAYDAFRNDENTGLSLRINWQRPNRRGQPWNSPARAGPEWFDRAKLEAVGYDCSVPLTDASADLYYDKMVSHEAYMVLAYGGEAWRAWLEEWERDIVVRTEQVANGKRPKQDLDRLKEAYEDIQKAGSRLIAVDIGKDPLRLRQQYPDSGQFLIVRVQVRLDVVRAGATGPSPSQIPYLRGEVTHLLVDEIHVPFEQRGMLTEVASKRAMRTSRSPLHGGVEAPRYEVTLHYGNRYEPWIDTIRPLQ